MFEDRKMLLAAAFLFYLTSVFIGATSAARELGKRGVDSRLQYLPADFPMDSMKNATPMACSDVITIPSIKLVQMTDAQMKAMFKDMGGNYVQDYMAATPEEAKRNFPNIIELSQPLQNKSGNYSMSVYDNYIAKQVIVDDMQKLFFYFLNKTSPDGRPAMGVKINTSTDNVTRPLTPSTYPTPIPIHTKPSTQHYLKPHLPPTTQSNVKASQFVNVSQSASHFTHILTTGKGIGTKSSSEALTSASKVESGTSVTTSTAGPTMNPAGSASSSNLNQFGSVTTTVDPDVAKSLEQLNKYLSGGVFGGEDLNLTSSDLDRIWREANTTLHPSTLMGLSPGKLRVKRDTVYDDSGSYCQMRGSLTSDKRYIHLCSSCAVTTQLTDDFFPRYINEAVCKHDDNSCFAMGNIAHGQCKQNVFTLNIMRRRRGQCQMVLHNGQTLAVDDWHLVHKTIRVSCECTINKLSVFRQYAGAAVG